MYVGTLLLGGNISEFSQGALLLLGLSGSSASSPCGGAALSEPSQALSLAG